MKRKPGRREQRPILFLDRNVMASALVARLNQAGVRVRRHDDHFETDTEDAVWLEEVGNRGWAVLTQDERILSTPREIIALLRANTHVFILKAKNVSGDEIADAFGAALPEIEELIRFREKPLLARVTRTGAVSDIEGYKEIVETIRRLTSQ